MSTEGTEQPPQPPLLYDVAIPGEQVLADDGPWLRRAVAEEGVEADPATRAVPPLAGGEAATAAPGSDSERPAERRAEIERRITRELAHHFRHELEQRLPEALREAQAPIRKAVDDALIDAVTASRRRAPSPQSTEDREG